MTIKTTILDHSDLTGGAWDAFSSTDGWARVCNLGPCAIQVSQTTVLDGLNVNMAGGPIIAAGDSILLPSDDGSGGTRIGISLLSDTNSLHDASFQYVSVIT